MKKLPDAANDPFFADPPTTSFPSSCANNVHAERNFRKFTFWVPKRLENDEHALEIVVNAEVTLTLDCNNHTQPFSTLIKTDADYYIIDDVVYISTRRGCPSAPPKTETHKVRVHKNKLPYRNGKLISIIAYHNIYVTCEIRPKKFADCTLDILHHSEVPSERGLLYED
jgi:serine protease inhibitor ecotin